MNTRPARFVLRAGIVAMALGATVALTGCLQSPARLPGGAATATVSPPEATTPPSPTSTASPTPKFTEDCGILLTSAQVYAYNPNYVADPGYSPERGTIPAAIAAQSGTACGWVNETSREKLEIAVASPSPTALASARVAASGGTPISASGEHGYFAVKNGVGSAQFFFGSLWLDVSSSSFAAPADAAQVYSTVVQNQLAAGG